MLRLYSRILFAGTFVVTLLVLLMVSLEVYVAVASPRLIHAQHKLIFVENIWGLALLAIFFLIMSGYLFAFIASYFLVTWKFQKWKRMLVNSLLFLASYLFLTFGLHGDDAILDFRLLVLGVASVVLSDAIADYFIVVKNKTIESDGDH